MHMLSLKKSHVVRYRVRYSKNEIETIVVERKTIRQENTRALYSMEICYKYI